MIILSKIPPSMEVIAQGLNQEKDVKKLKVDPVRQAILLSWEQRNARNPNNQQAQRLSNVPQGPNNQGFQQQQGGFRGGRGGKKRGRRRRGGGQQAQQQAQPAQDQQGPPTAGPSHQQIPSPPPAVNTFSRPSIFMPNVPSPLDFGACTSPVIYEPQLVYPTFNNALSLSHQLGVRPSIQVIKTLEMADSTTATTSSVNPCPHKRSRVEKDNDIDLLHFPALTELTFIPLLPSTTSTP